MYLNVVLICIGVIKFPQLSIDPTNGASLFFNVYIQRELSGKR